MSSGVRRGLAKVAQRLGLRKPKPQYAQIGKYRIRLPLHSQLLFYRSGFPIYDTALGQIAAVLGAKYPALHAIDIGANVGDTCALIRQRAEISVLCVEGDPILLPILTENMGQFGPGVAMEPSFVGPEEQTVNLTLADDLGRNASLIGAIGSEGSVKLRSLNAILADHPAFRHAKLLKIDTEGFDFDIIKQSMEFVRQSRPAIFFEYDPHFRPNEPRAGLETMEALIRAGYSDFLYYDNFGHFLLHTDASNFRIFADLDNYLASNRKYGTAVYYFDVCALHQEDSDLVPEIKSRTQSLSSP
jgi:FkbM family methyltransferase